jgi:hypothetical protein
MSKKLSALFIAAYLFALAYGLAAHAIGYKTYQHLGMYFVVWDMYCGWAGWETRTHLVGEGESGTYYDLDPGPFEEIKLFGDLGRRHYDSTGLHYLTLAKNTVAHTEHEPIVRYLVVEEAWAKKYNLPERFWNQRFDEPKEFRSYHRIRCAYDGDGQVVASNLSWHSWLLTQAIGNNPRLQRDVQQRTPFITTDNFSRSPDVVVPIGYEKYEPAQ